MSERIHTPLIDEPSQSFSVEKQAWLLEQCLAGTKHTRDGIIASVYATTIRPTKPNQTIWDGLALNNKLHDREPELLVKTIEQKIPTFFNGFPTRNGQTPTLVQKKAFIGEWGRIRVNGGKRQYGKPKLRNGKTSLFAPLI